MMKLSDVTDGELSSPQTLSDFLANAPAATTPNMGYGRKTAVVLQWVFFKLPIGSFTLPRQAATLFHEGLHAYSGMSDAQIVGTPVLQN
jgi:hypothetical protein